MLEVGGGTGGTTAWVAPSLPADRTRYLFTDIGPSMVTRAREKFAAHAFMDFQTLDLERARRARAGRRRFDLILASNVVHATSDLRQTLRRLRELLGAGGTLLMLEVAGLERWIDITFGLTEGWWFSRTPSGAGTIRCFRESAGSSCCKTRTSTRPPSAREDPRSRQVLLAARKPVSDRVPRSAQRPLARPWRLPAGRRGAGGQAALRRPRRHPHQ